MLIFTNNLLLIKICYMFKSHDNFYRSIKHYLLIKYVFFICIFSSFSLLAQDKELSLLNLPEGFSIEIFADNVKAPRQMAEGNKYVNGGLKNSLVS